MSNKKIETMFEKITASEDLIAQTKVKMKKAHSNNHSRKISYSIRYSFAACMIFVSVLFTVHLLNNNMIKEGYFTATDDFTKVENQIMVMRSTELGLIMDEVMLLEDEVPSTFDDDFISYTVNLTEKVTPLIIQGEIKSFETYLTDEVEQYGVFGFHQIEFVDYKNGDSFTAFLLIHDQSKISHVLNIGEKYRMYLYTGEKGNPVGDIARKIGMKNSFLLYAALTQTE